MAPLNQREQETVNRLEELRTQLREGTRLVTDEQLVRAEQEAAWAIQNAEVRAKAL